MNTKQKRIKLKNNNQTKPEQTEAEEYVFRFTDRYVRKKKIQMYSTVISVPILLFASLPMVGMFWDRGRFVGLLWVIYMLTLVVLLMIYGMNRIYGNDIRINNNRIHYYVTYKGPRGHLWSCVVFQAIKKVEVKRSKILIYGQIFVRPGFKRIYKKLAIPGEIENVDEFLRIAESLVEKE